MGTTNVEPIKDYRGLVALTANEGFNFVISAGEITTESLEKYGYLNLSDCPKEHVIIDDKKQVVIIEYFADGKRARIATEEEKKGFLEKQKLDKEQEKTVQAKITQEDINFVKKETGLDLEIKELDKKVPTKKAGRPRKIDEDVR